jgi:hypothetical protein
MPEQFTDDLDRAEWPADRHQEQELSRDTPPAATQVRWTGLGRVLVEKSAGSGRRGTPLA